MLLKTVNVPDSMRPIFQRAEKLVSDYFSQLKLQPSQGTIEISGERYVLVRAASLSVEFFSVIERIFGEENRQAANAFSTNLLFDLAHSLGKSDARQFHQKMNLVEPLEKLSAGPVHFSHSGWAFVDIFPDSQPSPDDEYFIVYDHPYSFEADAWIKAGRQSEHPVCIMNAGYSSGWCEESYNIPLVASELSCRAAGDDCCRFVMAPPHRIEKRIEAYVSKYPTKIKKRPEYNLIPDLFARKRIEKTLSDTVQALRQSEERFLQVTQNVQEWIWEVNDRGHFVYTSPAVKDMLGYHPDELVGKKDIYSLLCPKEDKDLIQTVLEMFKNQKPFRDFHCPYHHKDGRILNIVVSGLPRFDHNGLFLGYRGSCRDITEHRKLEQAVTDISNREQDRIGRDLHDGLGQQLVGVSLLCKVLEHKLAKEAPTIQKNITEINKLVSIAITQVRSLAEGLHPVKLKDLGLSIALESLAKNTEQISGISCNFINKLNKAIENETVAIHVYRIVQEAITNAIKHSNPTKITISLSQENNNVCLVINNNGSGIPPEALEQTEGMGLRIMRSRAEIIGGSLDIQSKDMKGTRVTCLFPQEFKIPHKP